MRRHVEEQGCGDLGSRRRDRRRRRTCLCARRGQLVSTGRLRPPVEAVARDIVAAGGTAETAAVDALDEQAIDQHLQSVVEKAGRVDVSFNAIGIPDAEIVGVPLVELDLEKFSRPIAGLHDVALPYRAPRGPADGREEIGGDRRRCPRCPRGWAARWWAATRRRWPPRKPWREVPRARAHGIRVVNLRPHAIPETSSIREVFDLKAAKVMTWEQWQEGSPAGPTRDGCRRSRSWPTWRPSSRPIRRAG